MPFSTLLVAVSPAVSGPGLAITVPKWHGRVACGEQGARISVSFSKNVNENTKDEKETSEWVGGRAEGAANFSLRESPVSRRLMGLGLGGGLKFWVAVDRPCSCLFLLFETTVSTS